MADKAKECRRGGRVTVLRRRIFLIAVLTMAMLFGFAVGINLYILRLNEDANRGSNQSDLRMVHSFLEAHQNGLRAILHSVISDVDISTIAALRLKEAENASSSYKYVCSLTQKLALLCSGNQDIASLYIVLPQADIVVSETGACSIATFLQTNQCSPLRDWTQEPSAISLGIFRGLFPPMYYNAPNMSGQYHVSASNRWACGVLLLSQDGINNKLARQFAGREMSLYVLTEENELYGWYEPNGTPLASAEVCALYEQGTDSTMVNGEVCDAYYARTGALRVVCLFRQDAIRQAFQAGYLLLSGMLAAFCALACGLYFAMVHWFYTPINNLLAVYGTEDSLGDADEYGRISHAMDSLRRDIASLEQRMRDSDRKAQEETRNRLRTMFPEEAAAVPGAYAVFSLVMENAEGVFQDSLCRKVCLSLSEVLETTVLYDHSASFTGVFGLRTETLPVERLAATLKATAGEGNYVRMGVSAIYTDRRFLANAYEEARSALESPAPGWLIVHDAQAASAVPSRFHVPLVKQAELASRLAEGDWALVRATLDDIYAENEGLNRYWQCRLSGYLMDLCLVLASNHPIDSAQMLCHHERQAASHNPELLCRRVYERYERLCEALRPGAEELAERMKRYIEKHLNNLELTLNDVAEHLNRSYSYVSACFSKAVGMPFTVYLQKRRVATAMRLLAETEEPVAQAARLVGYDLTGSFIRLFKKRNWHDARAIPRFCGPTRKMMPRKNSGHCTHQTILDGGLNRHLKFHYLCKRTKIGGKKNIMKTIWEPARQIPVCWEGDICVLGGSCTGLFAAVRAARLGASVCVVEKQNCFGGMATAGLVNVWHSLYDFDDQERIIAGLSLEVLERLAAQGQMETTPTRAPSNRFNPIALIRQLDLLAQENGVHTLLHTQYAGMLRQDDAIDCVFVQNKDGRCAIRAKIYIDATGDGDLMRDAGCERYMHEGIQPPSACFLLKGNTNGELISWLISQHGAEFGLDDDWGWFGHVPGLPGISFRADNHVFGFDLSRAEDLTQAEFEGRRRAYAFEALLKKYVSKDYGIVNMCSTIGIRETAHYVTRYQANEKDLLEGARFADAILNGTYCVDIHHSQDNGITVKHLDGNMHTTYGKGTVTVESNWRHEAGLDDNYSRYYQVPFSILVQNICPNLIPAGRMLHADNGAFGALRVMINTNQLGEAAGVAAYICVDQNLPIQSIDGVTVRKWLARGGSAL